MLAAAVLAPHRRWLAAGLAINLAVTIALPVAAIFADRWKFGDNLVLAGYVGQEAFAEHAAAEGPRRRPSTPWSAPDRPSLAAFFYSLRYFGLAIYAEPVEGFPPHHYAQKHPLPPGEGDVLYITRTPTGPTCRATGTPVQEVARWRPELGFTTREHFAFRVPRSCWFPPPTG